MPNGLGRFEAPEAQSIVLRLGPGLRIIRRPQPACSRLFGLFAPNSFRDFRLLSLRRQTSGPKPFQPLSFPAATHEHKILCSWADARREKGRGVGAQALSQSCDAGSLEFAASACY